MSQPNGTDTAAVYVAMIADRHADPEPHLFSTADKAIEYARRIANEYALEPADVDESHQPDGWLYHATYSEDDSVWVLAKEIDDTEDES